MASLVFTTCPPLATVELAYLHEHYCVRTFLDEPIIRHVDMRKLATLCAVADITMERYFKVAKDGVQVGTDVLAEVEQICTLISSTRSSHEVLDELGMLAMFPYLGQVLGKKATGDQHPGNTYLLYTSLMNQVIMMANQLYHDSSVPQHHKYSAHQIALLYSACEEGKKWQTNANWLTREFGLQQSLNMLQGDTKPIRKLIEERFEEIKGITESKRPILPVELCAWLQDVTCVCRDEVKHCPPYMHRRLERLHDVMRRRV